MKRMIWKRIFAIFLTTIMIISCAGIVRADENETDVLAPLDTTDSSYEEDLQGKDRIPFQEEDYTNSDLNVEEDVIEQAENPEDAEESEVTSGEKTEDETDVFSDMNMDEELVGVSDIPFTFDEFKEMMSGYVYVKEGTFKNTIMYLADDGFIWRYTSTTGTRYKPDWNYCSFDYEDNILYDPYGPSYQITNGRVTRIGEGENAYYAEQLLEPEDLLSKMEDTYKGIGGTLLKADCDFSRDLIFYFGNWAIITISPEINGSYFPRNETVTFYDLSSQKRVIEIWKKMGQSFFSWD